MPVYENFLSNRDGLYTVTVSIPVPFAPFYLKETQIGNGKEKK